jgi:hypothetical protein
MTTTQPTLVPAVTDFDSFAVRQAIAGFLAGYGDTTRDAYSLDLRQWLGWCSTHDPGVFAVRRAHIELFARSLEQDGKARATVARRLSTIAFIVVTHWDGGIEETIALLNEGYAL